MVVSNSFDRDKGKEWSHHLSSCSPNFSSILSTRIVEDHRREFLVDRLDCFRCVCPPLRWSSFESDGESLEYSRFVDFSERLSCLSNAVQKQKIFLLSLLISSSKWMERCGCSSIVEIFIDRRRYSFSFSLTESSRLQSEMRKWRILSFESFDQFLSTGRSSIQLEKTSTISDDSSSRSSNKLDGRIKRRERVDRLGTMTNVLTVRSSCSRMKKRIGNLHWLVEVCSIKNISLCSSRKKWTRNASSLLSRALRWHRTPTVTPTPSESVSPSEVTIGRYSESVSESETVKMKYSESESEFIEKIFSESKSESACEWTSPIFHAWIILFFT